MKLTQTAIRLRRISFYAYHGVLDQERTVGGEYWVDLTLYPDNIGAAVQDDRLDGTVNYAEAYEIVRREMAQPSALLEHVGGRIAQALFAAFPALLRIEVEVCKVNPPIGAVCEGASVKLVFESTS